MLLEGVPAAPAEAELAAAAVPLVGLSAGLAEAELEAEGKADFMLDGDAAELELVETLLVDGVPAGLTEVTVLVTGGLEPFELVLEADVMLLEGEAAGLAVLKNESTPLG